MTKSLIAVTPHLTACYKTCVLQSASINTTPTSNYNSTGSSSVNGHGGGRDYAYPSAATCAASSAAAGHNNSSSSRQQLSLHRCSSSSSDGANAAAGVAGGSATGRARSRKRQKAPSAAALAAAQGCRCFEVLGFDVLIDADLKPWLIEVNHSPSFNIDSPLDCTIKEALIVDTIKLVSGLLTASKR